MRDKKRFRRSNEFNTSAIMNNANYTQYYDRLTNIGISRFNWKGLPDGIDPRFLEKVLFEDGMAIFFKEDDLEGMPYLCLQCRIGGRLNVYRIPIQRNAYATNGYNRKLSDKDSVIIWNNLIHTPSKLDVEIFSQRLYNLDRTMDVNVNAQKTPVLILCDEPQRLTMKNLYMQYEGNQPFIFGGKDLDINAIKVLNTGAPYVCDRLYDLKQQYWNEALTYLGIPNVSNTKKERMITSEVDRTMGGVYANRSSYIKAREQACDEINKMFGLNISVEFNSGIYQEVDYSYSVDTEVNEESEGEDNE